MSSLTRIYISDPMHEGGKAIITGDDARHLTKVMRIRIGEQILVCDAVEGEYTATVAQIGKDSVEVTLGEYRLMDTEPQCPITVYQCLTKSDKMDGIIQKSVELGATAIIPVMSMRCISHPDEKSLQNKLERWRKIAYFAASQCGRARIPTVGELITYSEACRTIGDGLKFLCYEGEGTKHITEIVCKEKYKSISFIVGPEGGIEKSEAYKAAESGITLVGLGKRILRTETASGFVLSALSVLL